MEDDHGIINECDNTKMRCIQLIIDWLLCLASIIVSGYLLCVLKSNRWLEYTNNKKALLFYLTVLLINIMYSYFVYIANISECLWLSPKDRDSMVFKFASFIYSTCAFIIPFDYLIIHLHNNCDLF